ncbi:MAG TPA: hypothetical protein PLX85_06235, partial [Dehalococcoidia bacterium]|nr:hypothetical protein [Dehalococcoidia bacterium]
MIDAEAVHTDEQIRELDSPIGPGFTDPADLNAIDVANAFYEDERRAHEAALTAEVVRQEAEAEAVRQVEAQAAFDDGMTYVFGFNHEEGIRSFERAASRRS